MRERDKARRRARERSRSKGPVADQIGRHAGCEGRRLESEKSIGSGAERRGEESGAVVGVATTKLGREGEKERGREERGEGCGAGEGTAQCGENHVSSLHNPATHPGDSLSVRGVGRSSTMMQLLLG